MTASPPHASFGKNGLFARLAHTRAQWENGLLGFFGGAGSAARFDELHDQLLLADVGVEASARIIKRLRQVAGGGADQPGLRDALRAVVAEMLAPCEQGAPIWATSSPAPGAASPAPGAASAAPFVVLMVGVNGVGKTTTAAKIAARLQGEGRAVMLAACDTFRAAAIEQLQDWGRRLEVPVMAQSHGADAAAVAHDAYHAAGARGMEVLLVDTAGRQHTDADLMAQLAKIKRVLAHAYAQTHAQGSAQVSLADKPHTQVSPADKSPPPHDILLTVDATTGYNALSQVDHFHRAVGLGGLCLSKLDGTARGGVALALAERFGLPIRYVGVGESAADLRPFCAAEFAAALVPSAGDS